MTRDEICDRVISLGNYYSEKIMDVENYEEVFSLHQYLYSATVGLYREMAEDNVEEAVHDTPCLECGVKGGQHKMDCSRGRQHGN